MNSIATTAPAKMLAPGSGHQETRPEDLLWDSRGRIRTKDPSRDRTLHLFLLAFVILGVLALVGMKLDMEQLVQGVGEIPAARHIAVTSGASAVMTPILVQTELSAQDASIVTRIAFRSLLPVTDAILTPMSSLIPE